MAFDPVAHAREELAPRLRALCTLAREAGAPGQERFFGGVLRGIELAAETEDLADPLMQLSTSAFLGFEFDAASALLLDEILDGAQRLSEALSVDDAERH